MAHNYCTCGGDRDSCIDCAEEEIDRLKAELESKDKAIKLLQGHCNALMDTEGKLAQWKKGHTAGQEAAGYYQKQADDIIRQLRKELSDENANFTEEIMNLERQLAEARAEVERMEVWGDRAVRSMDAACKAVGCDYCDAIPKTLSIRVAEARQEAAKEIIQYIVDQGVIQDRFDGELVYYIIDSDINELRQRYGLEG